MKYTDPSGHYVETAIDLAFLAMDLNDIRTCNADKWTYVGLATDVVCAFVPGVTGGRLGVTALEETVTHCDGLADFFNQMDKMSEVTGATNKVDNVIDGEKTLEGLADGITLIDDTAEGGQYRRILGYDGKKIQINSGHGYQREHPVAGGLEEIGTMNQIESAIVLDVNSAVNSGLELPSTGSIERIVTVNNNQVGYRLMQTQDGLYRVSTYYPKID